MASQQPATTLNTITDEINAILTESTVYLSGDDLRIRRLLHECNKLMQANAADGWICKARIAQIQGDEEAFQYAIRNAERLDSTGEWEQTKGVGLLNLHRYSAAQDIFCKMIAPEIGLFGPLFPFTLNTGAYRSVHESYQGLPGKGMTAPKTYPAESIAKVSTFMRESNITDKDVAAFLDKAGDVLRRHSYMPANSSPQPIIYIMDGDSCLYFRYPLDVSPAQAATLNFELAELMVDVDFELLDKLHISFEVAQ